jgi:hypothetical protein
VRSADVWCCLTTEPACDRHQHDPPCVPSLRSMQVHVFTSLVRVCLCVCILCVCRRRRTR